MSYHEDRTPDGTPPSIAKQLVIGNHIIEQVDDIEPVAKILISYYHGHQHQNGHGYFNVKTLGPSVTIVA